MTFKNQKTFIVLRLIALVFLLIGGSNTSKAQISSWTLMNSGVTTDLYGVHFPMASIGYAVGVNGTILKTTNAGSSWTPLNSGTTKTLRSVYFTDAFTGYAVGYDGLILKTTNGGEFWQVKASPTTLPLYSICFSDEMTGYISGSGGVILKTINGGLSWASQFSNTIQPLYSIDFVEDKDMGNDIGYAVGGAGIILKSVNGGANWTSTTLSNGKTLYAVTMWGKKGSAMAAGTNGTIASTDGNNWTIHPTATSAHLYGITEDYFATGASGTILRDTDPPNNQSIWDTMYSGGTSDDLLGVHFLNRFLGYAVGKNGTILRLTTTTHSGGPIIGTWTDLTTFFYTPEPKEKIALYDVDFVTQNIGYAVGTHGSIFTTTNGLKSKWEKQVSPVVSTSWTAVKFVSASTGYVVGTYGHIAKTVNSGAKWNSMVSGTNKSFYGISFPSATTGYVVGEAGTILRTQDGSTWGPLSGGGMSDLNDVFFPNTLTGYIVGEGGKILKTINGTTWSPQTSGVGVPLYCVHFLDADVGFAGGSDDTILKTTNGGQQWTPVTINAPPNVGVLSVYDIHFIDSGLGFAVTGDLGLILKTIDGGESWELDELPFFPSWMYGLDFVGEKTGYAVGTLCNTLKYEDIEPSVLQPLIQEDRDDALKMTNEEGASFMTYPNPAEEALHFQIKGVSGSSVKMYIHNGKSCGTACEFPIVNGEAEGTLSTCELPPGLYVVEVITEKTTLSKKVMLR